MTEPTAEAPAIKPTGRALLREKIPDNLISPLPKGTKAQNQCPDSDKINCKICGGWHHKHIRHLSYVGHATATHLLLDADLDWNWEPLAFDVDGLPRFDKVGGLWIKLTVDGITRLGYGNAAVKEGDPGNREKEVIGDAIRNAAMRFGLALELWSKVDLHAAAIDDEDGHGTGAGDGGSERTGEGGQRGEPVHDTSSKKPPEDKADKPPYTDEMVKGWAEQLMAGKTTAAKAVAKIKTKYTITDAQVKAIEAMEIKQ